MSKERGFITKSGKYRNVFPRQEREEPYLVPHKRLSRYAIVRLRFKWKLVGGRWYVDKRIPPIWRKANREKDIYQEAVELFMQMDSNRRKRYKERDAHEFRMGIKN